MTQGRVVLVGGGPGAPDLITVRGLQRLREADVVITDRLAPTSLLDGVDARIIDAARGPDDAKLTRQQVIELMVSHARAGQVVVRFKGGDPAVLAHGPQEVEACVAAGVEVEVVPGVSSALAAPALAGVPLTAVDGTAGFTVVSGHLAPDDPENPVDWTALARSGTTLVVLMGMRRLDAIVARLLADGVAATSAAACVADASLPTQASVHTTLDQLPSEVAAAGLANPAVIVIAPARRPAHRVLVIGGSGSGKSAHAEALLRGEAVVDYLATAAHVPDDAEWDERIRRHRDRRPSAWRTVESTDPAVLIGGDAPVLLDSVTTWLARALDETHAWEQASPDLDAIVEPLVQAWRSTSRRVVAVTDQVGSGIVPDTASGRMFRDALGRLNQRLAADADEVHHVVAGIARRIK